MSDINQITVGGVTYDIRDMEAERLLQAALNRRYDGVDLTVKFAAEIAAFPFSGDPWLWMQARIRAQEFTGIYVGDYIPFIADSNEYIAEIAGINTYKRYGDGDFEVGNHIDFITRDCHPEPFVFNRADYNNGTTVSPSPWLASDLYARLNSLQQNVPNTATANPALVNADYRTTGILTTLPQALRDVIVQKRLLLPNRYTEGSLLTDDNGWAWADAGFLWLPSEMEVCGTNIWGSNESPEQGLAIGGFQQYPIFANNMKRVKGAGVGVARAAWWLLSAYGGYSTYFCNIGSHGIASHIIASNAAIRVPLCFRIS